MKQERCSVNVFSVKVDQQFVKRVHAVLSWPNNEEFADFAQGACKNKAFRSLQPHQSSYLISLQASHRSRKQSERGPVTTLSE